MYQSLGLVESSPILSALAIILLSVTFGSAVMLVLYAACSCVMRAFRRGGEPDVVHTDERTCGLPEVSEDAESFKKVEGFGDGWLYTPAEREARRLARARDEEARRHAAVSGGSWYSFGRKATQSPAVAHGLACGANPVGAWARRPSRVIVARSGVFAGERVRVIGESGELPGVWYVEGRGGKVTVLEGVVGDE